MADHEEKRLQRLTARELLDEALQTDCSDLAGEFKTALLALADQPGTGRGARLKALIAGTADG